MMLERSQRTVLPLDAGGNAVRLYKVKEVCALTGLSRKRLFDYRHIVNPAAYENPAGYKLYDEDAVQRLKEIALLRELDIPLKEIERLFADPEGNGTAILEAQIQVLKDRQIRHSSMLAVAEYMQSGGIDSLKELTTISTSVDELANYLREKA